MDKKEKYKKQKKDMRRYEAIRSFISSFTLTAIVVVAVATNLPKSPIATIESIKTFENEIAYQITITDEDQSLRLDSLEIVLDGQLDDYSMPLELGTNVGIFENLRPGTSYQLEVYGSKGFGQEKLTAMRVETKASSNGAIVSYELTEEVDTFYTYEVDVLKNDYENQYATINLFYAYLYPDEEPQFYQMVEIIEQLQTIELSDVFYEYRSIHLYLEAELINGEFLILDELTIYTPIHLSTDVFLDKKTANSLQFQFYMDYYFVENITYTAKLYDNKMIVDEMTITPDFQGFHHDGVILYFDNLRKDVDYRLEISSTYIDPSTKREETILLNTIEALTLSYYHIDYEVFRFEENLEIYMHLDDPNHYFQIPYVIIYEIVDGQKFYYSESSIEFTPTTDGKEATLEVIYPDLEHYEMIIGVRNQSDYTVDHIIIDEIYEK